MSESDYHVAHFADIHFSILRSYETRPLTMPEGVLNLYIGIDSGGAEGARVRHVLPNFLLAGY